MLKIKKHTLDDGVFHDMIVELSLSDEGKAKTWWGSILKNPTKFEDWFVLWDGNTPIAFATTQTKGFPDNHRRLLTRSYYYPEYRNVTMKYESWTPAMYILEAQLDLLDIKVPFISMEGNRHRYLRSLSNKIEEYFGLPSVVMDGLYYTCCGGAECQQTILKFGIHELELKEVR